MLVERCRSTRDASKTKHHYVSRKPASTNVATDLLKALTSFQNALPRDFFFAELYRRNDVNAAASDWQQISGSLQLPATRRSIQSRLPKVRRISPGAHK